MFEDADYFIPIFLGLFFYPYIHTFLRWIGKRILHNKKWLKTYIRLVNVVFLFACNYVLAFFIFTDFSITSGWEEVYGDERFLKGRNLIIGLIFILFPPFMFLISLMYGWITWSRIKNPTKALNEDDDF